MAKKQLARPQVAAIIGQKDVDATGTGLTVLGEAAAGVYTIPSRVAFIAQNVSGVTTAPTVSVGVTGPDYDDLVAAVQLTELTATGLVKLLALAMSKVLSPGTEVKLNVSTAATATTFALKVGVEVAED